MKELKKQWKNGEFGRCYLFFGAEAYLMKDYVEGVYMVASGNYYFKDAKVLAH